MRTRRSDIRCLKPDPAVAALSAHFARQGKARLDHLRTAEVGTSDQRNHGVVGTGGAVRPFTLCLSAQGPRCTDPTIAPAFDGLKISVSRRAKFIDRSLLGSSFLGPRNEGFNPNSLWPVGAGRPLSINPQPHDREWDNRRIVRPRRSIAGGHLAGG
jgi:hypothetical protein